MNTEKEVFSLLSRLEALTREADEMAASAQRINAELVSIQRDLYRMLNPSANGTNGTHA